MRVVVLGSGGREQAIAHACRAHGHTAELRSDIDAVLADPPHLVIVGPEALLADGAADRLNGAGIPCFGPTAALARLESSKGFARDLAGQLGIPGPRHWRFDDAATALAEWESSCRPPIVVKADGLAAGKGVIVPTDEESTRAAFATIGAPLVVEERMRGMEVTLLAVCDGVTARPLPLSTDHKRIGAGDQGPNTGGMGAVCPVPAPVDLDALTATFVQPIVDHFATAGTPYIGMIYAGLMLTADGPRLVEYNCRFGDPEAQAVLAVLDTDLAALALACTTGDSGPAPIRARAGVACTVVAAAAGYPGTPVTGAPITLDGSPLILDGSMELGPDVVLHPAGMTLGPQPSTVSGGRILSVTAVGDDLDEARRRAYAAMDRIRFDGMQVRPDIGWRARAAAIGSYASTGVDIDEGSRAVTKMRDAVEATHGPAVLRGVGSFGGAFSASAFAGLNDPVLVGSTDGVGTKVELAARAGRYAGVGMDIVNHCVDDVLVQGARPLFFLDYVASSRIRSEMIAEVVGGMAAACSANGCALLGGETAEMPGVYHDGAFDIAGTLVGVVDRAELLPRPTVAAGDTLIGIASSGPHTNGYSLLRRLFDWLPLDAQPEPLDRPLIDALLEPHRSYLGLLGPLLTDPALKAMAHITGGGLAENLPRILPQNVGADIELGSWPIPPLFRLVQQVATGMPIDELYRTLNMGIGMVLVTDRPDSLQALIPEETWVIGTLRAGHGEVVLR